MKILALTTIALTAMALSAAGIAVAQTPPAADNSTTPAVPPAGMPGTTQNAPSAQKQIEASGYTDVKSLIRQNDGSWRARATKNNAEVSVAVDSTGNVTEIQQ